MRGKINQLILLFSAILSLISLVFTQITSSNHLETKNKIELTIQERKEFLETSEKEKKESAFKLAFEKKRREELALELELLRKKLDETEDELDSKKDILQQLETKILQNESVVLNANEAERNINEAKKKAIDQTTQLAQRIPDLENKLSLLKRNEESDEFRIRELRIKLTSFQSTSDQLRQHFQSSLKGIREYIRERPWIEAGDILSPSLHSIDHSTGTVALSIGAEDGVRTGMQFSVLYNKNEVGRLKIMDVQQNRAVGTIMPLHGQPNKLKKAEKIDLINL